MTGRRGLLGAAVLARPAWAWAQDRPVRVLVGFAPGGGVDILVRSLAPKLSELLGQQVLVENRPGAGATVATEAAVRAAPDGLTLVFGSVGTLIVNPLIFRDQPYDVARDLVPVALAGDISNVLVVPAGRPWRDLAAMLAAARAVPGRMSWGHSGVGTSGHLTGSLLNSVAGLEAEGIVYRGGAPLATDLVAGRLDWSFATVASVLPQIRDGALRALAVPTLARQQWLAEVPTMQEAGLPGFVTTNWGGLLAPRGTPPAVVGRLEAAMRQVQRDPGVAEILARNALAPLPGGAAEFASLWASERERWTPVIKASGATPD